VSTSAVRAPDRPGGIRTAPTIAVAGALAALVLALVPAAFLLSGYSIRAPDVAFGFDTPTYVWQAKETGALGLVDPTVITRPGFPLLVAVLHGVLGVPEYQLIPVLAFTLPGLVGLAAAGAVRSALGPGAVRAAAVGLVVGTSFLVARLAGGLYGNLLALLLLVAALVPLAGAMVPRPWLPAAFVLLFATGLAHWMFLGIFGVILVGAAVWFVVARRLLGRPAPPGTRILLALGTGALAGILALAVLFPLLGGTLELSGVTRLTGEFLSKFRGWFRQSGPLLVLPLTAVGAAALARESEDRPGGFLRIVCASWLGLTVAAMIGWRLWPAVPLHRFWLFALPVPLLAGLGAEAAGSLGGSALSRWNRVAGQAVRLLVTSALVAAASVPAFRLVNRGLELYMTREDLQEATDLAAYVSWLPDGHPVVVILDMPRASAGLIRHRENVIRSALPGERQPNTFFYWGRPELLLQGRPTPQDKPKVRLEAESRWEQVRQLDDPFAVVVLERFDPDAFASAVDGGAPTAAPGIAVLRGPVPDQPLQPPVFDDGPLRGWAAGALAAAIVLLLGLLGIAWAVALLPGAHPFVTSALAPAFGAAVLLPAAILVQAIGISLAGPGGLMATAIGFLAGVALWVGLRRARGRRIAALEDESVGLRRRPGSAQPEASPSTTQR
jgi:hypothetical protein